MIISDEKKLKYRTALQIERDYLAEELGVFTEDLRVTLIEMKNQGRKPEYSQDVKNYGRSVIERLASAHLELQFPEFWPTESAAILPKIIDAVSRFVFPLAENSKEVIGTMVQVSVPGQIEQLFAQIHGEMEKSPSSETVRTAEITPPPLGVSSPVTEPALPQTQTASTLGQQQIPPTPKPQANTPKAPTPPPPAAPPQSNVPQPPTNPPNNQTK